MSHLQRFGPLPGVSTGIPVLETYQATVRRKVLLLFILAGSLIVLAVAAVMLGKHHLPLPDVVRGLMGSASETVRVLLWNIRLPRIAAAVAAGWSLALAGMAMQSLLRNPLGSPLDARH